MKKFIISTLLFAGFAGALYAAEKNRIELSDGSVLEGNIVSFENGVYTLQSDTLGMLRVDQAKVEKIESIGASSAMPATPGLDVKGQMENIKTSITENPQIMNMVAGLLSDPQFKEVLNDPKTMQEVNSQDFQALSSNQKFLALMDNSNLDQIKKKLKT